jgi:hypothetical protein
MVRFDLAPRRARLLGNLKGPWDLDSFASPADPLNWVVVFYGPGTPPKLVASAVFCKGMPRNLGRRDDGIPASIDRPGPGEPVVRELLVTGWCQERGGLPCPTILFTVDGRERKPASLDRFARPDVEAVVAGIGKADTAGYRATLRFDPEEAGSHHLDVIFKTVDGRYRRHGPVPFQVTP